MRFRALLFGQPLAPWQATKELAEQSAMEAGEASRDPHSGFAFLSPGVTIEKDDGEAPMTPDMERWAEALAIVKMHGARAMEEVEDRIRALAHDSDGQTRWRAIGGRVRQVLDAAEKDARQ